MTTVKNNWLLIVKKQNKCKASTIKIPFNQYKHIYWNTFFTLFNNNSFDFFYKNQKVYFIYKLNPQYNLILDRQK